MGSGGRRRSMPKRVLSNQPTFWEGLSASEKASFRKQATSRTVYKGDIILSDGMSKLAVLMPGCWTRLEVEVGPHSRTVVDISGPGDLVSVLHAIEPARPYWLGRNGITRAVVLKKGVVLEVPSGRVSALIASVPAVQQMLVNCAITQLHIGIQARASSHLDVSTRLARLLLDILYRFGENRSEQHKLLTLAPPLSQSDLAAWIGASLASVARVLRNWRSLGIIRTVYGSISLVDLKRMREEAVGSDAPWWEPPWGMASIPKGERIVRDPIQHNLGDLLTK
ncbi:Crp/Fnr family transcriptional regulator [Sphaerisporangium fuscum]|uniref:Crp/Fnr family transcriptional regulator n=1 Tax=Sphaerisporangium fuscum TaxID=2835868 RepID=UPI0035580071